MKLTWRIVIRISLLMSAVLTVWAIFFNNAVMHEVSDETDDSLEFFSENLIKRVLRGEELPAANNGTNNTYFLEPVSEHFAKTHSRLEYSNEIVYIKERDEEEPARVLRTIFQDDNDNYQLLTVATPSIDTEDLQQSLTSWIIILYLTILLLIIVVCLWVLWHSMRPLYRILQWLNNNDISKGVEPLINPTNINEFNYLNDAIMRSAQKSEQLYTQQKEFTGNASHEIQTPLAVCKNRLDLLLSTQLTENQMGEIIKVQQTLDYISRINRELLLLAKIDGGQFTDRYLVNISALSSKISEDCEMVYNQKEIKLLVDNTQQLDIEINTTLASVMVTNLIKNAFIYCTKSGTIIVSVKNDTLTVINSGEKALNKEQIFERFYQEQKREGSTGLGLAIVKSITMLYGFYLSYDFMENNHIFSIKFK